MKFKELGFKPYSSHPDDSYLQIVLSETGNSYTPWATHLRNSSGEKPYLVEGHYFQTLLAALEDFGKRGKTN